MKIGVVGLGLIGGSLAKAYKRSSDNILYGYDINPSVTEYAMLTNTVDGVLTDGNIGGCDCIFICVYPKATVEYLKEKAGLINKDCVVIDCGGVKQHICEECNAIAAEHGFTFIGGHPMAGLHRSGLKWASEALFDGASMILTPHSTDDIELLSRVTATVKAAGFASVTVTTPEKHDKIIAFTSQLAHVVSNAYVKSPEAQSHRGFSAGSYKDLTRVAKLNEDMWAELFMENRENLVFEIDTLIKELEQYKTALQNEDTQTLKSLLKDGSERKERIDG